MRTTWTIRPPAIPGIEALIKEARRRQRIRYLLTAVVCLAVLGSGAGLYASLQGSARLPPDAPRSGSSPAGSHQAGPAPIPPLAARVLMWPLGFPLGVGDYAGPPFVIDDLRTRRYIQTGTVDLCCGDYQPLLITTGRWLVYVGNGATAIRSDLTGRPRVLGKTPFFAPAATAGDVWLEYFAGAAASVRVVRVAGGPSGPLLSLPAGTRLVAGTEAGLLLQDRGGTLRLWHPGGMPTQLPYSPNRENGFVVTPRLIAYGTRCHAAEISAHAAFRPNSGYQECSVLRVLMVRTGQLLSFRPPAGTTGWVPPGFGLENPIPPSGSMIAAEAAVPSADGNRGRLYIARLAGRPGHPVSVPSSAGYLFGKAAWSPDGSWLFYQGPNGRLWGYRVRSGAVRSSTVPCCQYTVMTVVPARLTAASRHR